MRLSSFNQRYSLWMAAWAFLSLAAPAFGYDILMFGDSITQGLKRNGYLLIYGITSPPNGARVDGSYGPTLERLLASSETSFAYNWGWGGEVTKTGVNRIDSVLASRPADYILVLEGANDLIGGLSAETTTTNLGIMIDKARRAGIEPILSDLTPFSCPVECNADGRVVLLNTKIAALAQEKNVVLSMVHAPLAAGWETAYTSGDGIHLNDDGYVIMADSWYEAIVKAIGKNITPVLQLLLL
ncbi:MAG: SGNH/GDSL hydrolase family protein, partial [Desulforhopalus sp.]